jgi:hypothetical protein
MAAAWFGLALVTALLAVSSLRRIPSVWGLDVLGHHRVRLIALLWVTYGLALATGAYLLWHQTIDDPPVSGSDWSVLRDRPYGVPYYYAMYAKIGLFLLMGGATVLLARGAVAADVVDADGEEPLELEAELDDATWAELVPLAAGGGSATLLAPATTAVSRRAPAQDVATWGAVGTVTVGMLGVGFCVTLIKYFHELSRSAVVYQRLRGQ